jgi:hypothetical protein
MTGVLHVTPTVDTLEIFGGPTTYFGGVGVSYAPLYIQVGGADLGDHPFSMDAQLSSVPDGGTTVMLLGGVLAGLAVLRRRLRA